MNFTPTFIHSNSLHEATCGTRYKIVSERLEGASYVYRVINIDRGYIVDNINIPTEEKEALRLLIEAIQIEEDVNLNELPERFKPSRNNPSRETIEFKR